MCIDLLYKFLWWGILLLLNVPLFAQQPFVCQNNFYFSFSTPNGISQLHEVIIDIDGNVDFVPLPNSTGQSLNAIGYRSTDNLIYAVGVIGQQLYQIDATGRSFPLGILDVNHQNGFYAATITPNGEEMILVEQSRQNSIALVKIDLTDPNYAVKQRIPLSGATIQTTDIAFDPLTGLLYGYDSNSRRLITINPANGVINTPFPVSNVADRIGGIYFDAFGNVFGYGNARNDNQARNFFGINKNTGVITNLGTGPNTSGKDGCACPFTIDLLKNVTPRQVVPCTEVTYTFEIANLSGTKRTEVVLSDTMPEDFVILEVPYNPYGGMVEGIGTNILNISGMTIPLGMDSIQVVIETLPFAEGIYKNQAHLGNLPEGLGGRTISDDPTTLLNDDSTSIEVFPLVVDLENQQQNLCEGATIELVAGTINGIDYQWNTGSTEPSLSVSTPGTYAVTITNGCEVEIDSVFISEEPISVDLGADMTINLGDYLTLKPVTNAIGALQYNWTDVDTQFPYLDNCSTLEVRPFFNTNYEVSVTSLSGCTATDQVNITVTKERGIYIPNVFSPNGDGINDRFYIMGKGFAEILILNIYDRWGNLVFAQNSGPINDSTTGWDGLFQGKNAQSAVYHYYAKLVYLDLVEESFVGDLTLVR